MTYVCEWNNNNQKTWSGTTYSLFKAISKNNEVTECDMTFKKWQMILLTVCNIRIIDGKIKTNNPFRKLTIICKQKKLNSLLRGDKSDHKLIVGDFGICNNAYYYMDISVDALIYLRENKPRLFGHVNFDNVPTKDLIKRGVIQNAMLNNAKCVFTMGKWLEENLINYSGLPKEKVCSVGGGINLDIDRIHPEVKTNNKILFVGRDFYRKGGDLVIEAFHILKEKYLTNAELYIAGVDPNLINAEKNVIILGDLSPNQLSDYFNKCDIFCMPSRFEAYGLVFIEALVYGLPCIGRNCFEMKEFIQNGETGYLIEDDDKEILASRMYELLNNDNIKSNVIKRREEYINKYSWESVSERITKKIFEIGGK
ncbi:hypothetical protein A7L45_18680 [Clostridium estertheticum subsp. estertheticum]|uniref:Glycosyl transferase family 1 domain-containing protein n=1 Tax=Clostridium estertheticum subsp. estertheticum TaxID=1552 RepID=A0A1J0GN32_9CLOT|nr:hypothetical protein A7L45_18680 [Clostridium estertheticum subsp. estertheticum]